MAECTAFKNSWLEWKQTEIDANNFKYFLEAKAMAIQQAGVIPMHKDVEAAYEAVEAQLATPDGLR